MESLNDIKIFLRKRKLEVGIDEVGKGCLFGRDGFEQQANLAVTPPIPPNSQVILANLAFLSFLTNACCSPVNLPFKVNEK